MISQVKAIKALPLAYNEADFENSARKIVFEMYHHWKTDPGPVVIHRFTDGIMNTVCFVKPISISRNLNAV